MIVVVLVQVDMGSVVVGTDGCAVYYTLNISICLWSQITRKLLWCPSVAHTKAYISDDIIFFVYTYAVYSNCLTVLWV